jgi:hypothetical protein
VGLFSEAQLHNRGGQQHFVATKVAEQVDLHTLHRVRERLMNQRTGIKNEIRTFLLDRDVTRPCTLNHASLTHWVLNFTKPFLAFRPKIFGIEGLLTTSLRASSDNSFNADVSERYGVYADEKAMACLEFMEKRRAVLIGALGLTVGALSFWITLSLIDYGFWRRSPRSLSLVSKTPGSNRQSQHRAHARRQTPRYRAHRSS